MISFIDRWFNRLFHGNNCFEVVFSDETKLKYNDICYFNNHSFSRYMLKGWFKIQINKSGKTIVDYLYGKNKDKVKPKRVSGRKNTK